MTLPKKVVCAISGGVDSCISAYLLKQKGFNVHGIFMRNWDVMEENTDCSIDEDAADAAYICAKLKIPFQEVNFVREYWNEVFCDLIEGYTNGITPNPDVLCNQRIKFGHFFKHAVDKLGADYIATGHYAKSSLGQFLENKNVQKDRGTNLLRPKDQSKDQTLFLSQINQQALSRTMFPIGGYFKTEVKQIAKDIGMEHFANKKESAGICFIGRRNFQDFMSDYVKPIPGNFVDLDSGKIVGKHNGVHLWTIGQRVLIGGLNIAYFVLNKITDSSDIYVVSGWDHPALYHDQLILGNPHWINRNPFLKSNQDYYELKNRNLDSKNIDLENSTFKNQDIGESNLKTDLRHRNDNYLDNSYDNHFSTEKKLFYDKEKAKKCSNSSDISKDLINEFATNNINSKQLSNDNDKKLFGITNSKYLADKIKVQFRFQHPHTPIDCFVTQREDRRLAVHLSKPMRAISPGQYGVLYDGEICLGSAPILRVVSDNFNERKIREFSSVIPR